MSEFLEFKKAITDQLDKMSNFNLFKVDIGKNDLWNIYLNGFKPEDNPVYKERTEHDCQCCKQFIRNIGSIVYIKDNKLVSVWDVTVDNFFQDICNQLAEFVRNSTIKAPYLHYETRIGTDHNHQLLDNGTSKKWEHLHYQLDSKFVMRKDRIPTKLGKYISNKDVLLRTFIEISEEAIETIIELIDQNSLYRGTEHKDILNTLLKYKQDYLKLSIPEEQDNFTWQTSMVLGDRSKVRNTSIGTLLIDLSEGMSLDGAVAKFEAMVAPANYKRTTALISKSMIASAEKKVAELGIQDSLQRRYAITDDITINNVIYADRTVKEAKGVFSELYDQVSDNNKNLDKVEEVSIDTFIDDILPKATSIEVMLENKNSNNLMSIIAPQNIEAKPMLKWGNNFTWSYNGEVTDSIKERVKLAGGNVNGVLRCSLSWFNSDDLDIHIIEPNGNHIYYSNARNHHDSSGVLDVDMNAGGTDNSINPVENITWSNKSQMQEGNYVLKVHNYSKRSTKNIGFIIEMEYENKIYTFNYDKAVRDGQYINAVNFNFSKENGVKIIESIPSTKSSKEIWNINTEKFHKVNMIMNSPNHWDDNNTGNKHIFFILDKCKNSEKTRGFYNEFLDNKLQEHRKVFEVLGSKMKVAKSDDQLSGLGFSTTQRNSLLCKVTGSFNRTIKINF